MNLKSLKTIHFIGIGGIGMSALAEIVHQFGIQVTGSDRQLSSITHKLENKGIRCFESHSENNISDQDLVVYSSAVQPDNPERQAALKKNIQLMRRAEFLGEIIKLYPVSIGVAGTHGKTSTSALLAHVIEQAKLDPTIIIGGISKDLNSNARLGKGQIILVEADEYDRSFLALKPTYTIVTTIEEDHLDIYKDLSDIKQTFLKYTDSINDNGTNVINIDDNTIFEMKNEFKNAKSYAINNDKADLYAKNISFKGQESDFDVYSSKGLMGHIKINIPGEHSISNALAVISLSLILDIPFKNISKALENFKGVHRRFEKKFNYMNTEFYDDYAHHPSEIKATLNAARTAWKERRIIVIFQPHLFSRTKDFAPQFAEALSLADTVFVTDIYPAREAPIPGVTGKLITDFMTSFQADIHYIPEINTLVTKLANYINPGDLVILMGAGNISSYTRNIFEEFKAAQIN